MIIQTNHFHKYDHKEFSFNVNKLVLDSDIQWFINFLEKRIKTGTVFKSEETLQVGMITTKFRLENDYIKILEPDFKSMPIKWVDSVSKTLNYLRVQREMVSLYNLYDKLEFSNILHSVLITENYNPQSNFFIERERGIKS